MNDAIYLKKEENPKNLTSIDLVCHLFHSPAPKPRKYDLALSTVIYLLQQ
jgi:hypothetical protein